LWKRDDNREEITSERWGWGREVKNDGKVDDRMGRKRGDKERDWEKRGG